MSSTKGDLKPGTSYRLEHRPQAKSRQICYVRLTERCLRAILESAKESSKRGENAANSVSIKFDNEDFSRGRLMILQNDGKSQSKVFTFDQYGQSDGSMRVSSVYSCERSGPKRLSLLGCIDQRIGISASELSGLKASAGSSSDVRAVTDEQLETLKTHCVYLLSGLDGWIGKRELIDRLNKEMYGNFSNYHRTVRRDLLERVMKTIADQMDGASAIAKSRESHYRLNAEKGLEALRRLSRCQLENWRHYSASERQNALRLHSKKTAELGNSVESPPAIADRQAPAIECHDGAKSVELCQKDEPDEQNRRALFDEYLQLYDFIESVAKEFKALSEQFNHAEDDKERREIEKRIHDRYDQIVGSGDYRQRRRRYEELYNILLPYCEIDKA